MVTRAIILRQSTESIEVKPAEAAAPLAELNWPGDICEVHVKAGRPLRVLGVVVRLELVDSMQVFNQEFTFPAVQLRNGDMLHCALNAKK